MATTFNLFDLIFFTTIIIFTLIAFFRGFIKEIFSFFIWIISAVFAYFLSPFLAEFLSSYYKNENILYFATRLTIFIILFLTLSFSLSETIKNLKEKVPTIFDKSFGALFGVLKTILIFAIFYSAIYNTLSLVMKNANIDIKEGKNVKMPIWIREAKCGNILKISSSVVDPLVEIFVEAVAQRVYKSNLVPKTLDDKIIDDTTEQISKEKNNIDNSKKDDVENSKDSGGYNKRDIEKMNRLIEIVE